MFSVVGKYVAGVWNKWLTQRAESRSSSDSMAGEEEQLEIPEVLRTALRHIGVTSREYRNPQVRARLTELIQKAANDQLSEDDLYGFVGLIYLVRCSRPRKESPNPAPQQPSPALLEQIPYSAIQYGDKMLGEGTFGTVHLARLRGTPCAVKTLKQTEGMTSEKLVADFEKEAMLLGGLRHPNILSLLAVCTESPHLCLVTELCEGGNLTGHLARVVAQVRAPTGTSVSVAARRIFPWAERRRIAIELLRGLVFLHEHSRRIVHRDIKPQNVLLDAHGTVKLSDFGLAKVRAHNTMMNSLVGTPAYIAPEVLTGEGYNETSDIYSTGVILWEIATLREPFDSAESLDQMQLLFSIVNGARPGPIPGSPDCPEAWGRLIERCWDAPANRPSATQLLEMIEAVEISSL